MSKQLNSSLSTTDIIWNLTDLYKSREAKELTEDIAWCKKEAVAIQQEFSGRLPKLSAQDLLLLITRLETLETKLGRIATFAYLGYSTSVKDPKAGAFLQQIKEMSSRISKETVFFELEWNSLDKDKAALLTNDELLSHYRHHLESLRRYAPHLLSQTEEKLLIEKSPVGKSSWTSLFDKVIAHIKFGPHGRTEEEVLTDLYNSDRQTREGAAQEMTDGLNSQIHILTHVFNTILADKMIDDRLRKYDYWVSSMNLYNELAPETVQVLVDSTTGRYDIVKRYYNLKREMLDVPELNDYDRYAPLPHLPEVSISWPECREMVLESFASFAPQCADIAAMFFERQWIHAPILDGKRGGAFAHPCVPDVHPYVMVNYTGNLRDVSTVAHELGHGVHQYLAAGNGYYNSSTTLVLAETASVFAELLLFQAQLEKITNKDQRRAFICQKLESIFATVFRQVAMNRFEDRIHNARRDTGELSTEAISKHWRATQEAMFAGSVNLTDNYSIWWSYIPHFLSTPGYVYSYAFGELLVLSLYKMYLEDKEDFVPKYINLLKSGGIDSPYKLLEPFGVDLNDHKFWKGGLSIIEDMLLLVED